MRIEGASVEGSRNVEAFWSNRAENGDIRFDTRSVRYSPNYNEFRNGPDLVYEHSLVAAEFDGAVLARTGQTAVRGNATRLSLTMIDGDLSQSSVERRSFDPETLSQQRRTVTLQPDEDTVTLVLPTTVEEEKRGELAGEWESTIDGDVETSVEDEAIHVEIETDRSITLGLSQVGLGDGTSPTDESAGYITRVGGDDEFVAEVRDEYNNPVEGATVGLYDDSGVVSPSLTETTDSDGRISVSNATIEELRINVEDESRTDADDWERWERLDTARDEETDPDDPMFGPDVRNVDASPSELEAGTDVDVSATIDSVGTAERLRSGTPIQRVEVVREAPDGSTESTIYDDYDPDDDETTARVLEGEPDEPLSTDDWEEGIHEITVRGQDASGRWTPTEDASSTTVEVVDDDEEEDEEEPTEFESVSASNMVANSDDESQTFTFALDGELVDGDEVEIDLEDAQDSGAGGGQPLIVDYPSGSSDDGTIEILGGSGSADLDGGQSPGRDQDATLTYTADESGDSAGTEIELTVNGIEVGDIAGQEYDVVFEGPSGEFDETTTFGIAETAGDIFVSGTQDGNLFSTGSITVEQGNSIEGKADADGSVTMEYDSAVEGSITSRDTVSIGQESTVGEGISADGSVTMEYDSAVEGSITSRDTVSIGQESTVGEGVSADRDITVGPRSTVEGSVTSQDTITLDEDSTVEGAIDGEGSVTMEPRSTVESIVSGGTVLIAQDATVEGEVVASESVELGYQDDFGGTVEGDVTAGGDVSVPQNGRVGGDVTSEGSVELGYQGVIEGGVFVSSASNIVCGQGSTIDGQSCEDYVDENY
ncbi:hypothetical protein [Halorubrum gandharaense]